MLRSQKESRKLRMEVSQGIQVRKEQQKQAAEVLLWQSISSSPDWRDRLELAFPQAESEIDIDKPTIAGNVRSSLWYFFYFL